MASSISTRVITLLLHIFYWYLFYCSIQHALYMSNFSFSAILDVRFTFGPDHGCDSWMHDSRQWIKPSRLPALQHFKFQLRIPFTRLIFRPNFPPFRPLRLVLRPWRSKLHLSGLGMRQRIGSHPATLGHWLILSWSWQSCLRLKNFRRLRFDCGMVASRGIPTKIGIWKKFDPHPRSYYMPSTWHIRSIHRTHSGWLEGISDWHLSSYTYTFILTHLQWNHYIRSSSILMYCK